MTQIISVISGKGGVGKTTLVSNLSVALAELGKNVLVIDGNVSGPNLGLHLGVPVAYPVTLNQVLKGEAFPTQAIYRHPSGFNVIPASLVDIDASPSKLKRVIRDMVGYYDYILIDAGVGANEEVKAAIDASDKVIIVTNPELPALTNAALAARLARESGREILGVVVNRWTGQKYEVPIEDIIEFLELPILGIVPEHKKVRECISAGTPVVEHKPWNKCSHSFRNIARTLVGEEPRARTLGEVIRGAIGDLF